MKITQIIIDFIKKNKIIFLELCGLLLVGFIIKDIFISGYTGDGIHRTTTDAEVISLSLYTIGQSIFASTVLLSGVLLIIKRKN